MTAMNICFFSSRISCMNGTLDGTVIGLRPWTLNTEKELSISVLDVPAGLVPENCVVASAFVVDSSK